jgi:hypothetical protein
MIEPSKEAIEIGARILGRERRNIGMTNPVILLDQRITKLILAAALPGLYQQIREELEKESREAVLRERLGRSEWIVCAEALRILERSDDD